VLAGTGKSFVVVIHTHVEYSNRSLLFASLSGELSLQAIVLSIPLGQRYLTASSGNETK
jgi:hypothetical protein